MEAITNNGALELRDLHAAFGTKVVLNGVSLRIEAGLVQGLLGENGAGKTTTLDIASACCNRVAAASCWWAPPWTPAPHERARRGLGFLPQGPSVFLRLSVLDNLRLAAQESPPCAATTNRFATCWPATGWRIWPSRQAGLLSGGERRRLEIARTMLLKPRCVLLDEPFSGLDPLAVERVRCAHPRQARRGVAVLLTDHNVQAALTACDKIALLWDGGILLNETPQALRTNEQARRLYFGNLDTP
jgi:lipopolysaccharide export system ATP-binding protein